VELIAGLGNPGPRFRDTRHNIGFQVIEEWCRQLGVRLTGRRFQSRNTRAQFQGNEIMLLCPATFMNQSGRSLRECVDFYRLHTEEILVIHDDLDLTVGRVKVVRKGGAGGHKGVASIIQSLGTMDFPRVRIGIGRPRYGEETEDYVLARFYRDEICSVSRAIQVAVRACELFVSEGIESTMNIINGRDSGLDDRISG
jgi:peptidyl-tRNA hydrolase, PTH1 family